MCARAACVWARRRRRHHGHLARLARLDRRRGPFCLEASNTPRRVSCVHGPRTTICRSTVPPLSLPTPPCASLAGLQPPAQHKELEQETRNARHGARPRTRGGARCPQHRDPETRDERERPTTHAGGEAGPLTISPTLNTVRPRSHPPCSFSTFRLLLSGVYDRYPPPLRPTRLHANVGHSTPAVLGARSSLTVLIIASVAISI